MSAPKPIPSPRSPQMHGGCPRGLGALKAAGIALLLLAVQGCSSKPNPIASNVSYGPNDRFATRILSASDRDQVIEIMKESVDRPANDPARPAEYGVRWSDVALAADKASRSLELAVLSVTDEEEGKLRRFRIVSVGEQPVELVIRRVAPPRIYVATATAGLFGNRNELADRLVREFDAAMRAYGSKPGWPPLVND